MRDLSSWLPDIDPPRGGLARLRRSVQVSRPHGYWRAVGIAACAMLVFALIVLPATLQRHRNHTQLAEALRQALRPVAPQGLRIDDGAAMALESGQPGVRLYLVQSERAAVTLPR